MTIEERAEKWAKGHAPTRCDGVPLSFSQESQFIELLRDAYLAGSAQTQADYTAPSPPPGSPCERHGEIGCAWCIPGPYEFCPRCECSCGAR